MPNPAKHDKRRRRMTLEDRQVRRKFRRLQKMVSKAPAHVQPLASAYAELASQSTGIEERLALQNIQSLLVANPDSAAEPGATGSNKASGSTRVTRDNIVTVLNEIDNPETLEKLDTPSTPGGHPDYKTNPLHINIYSPKRDKFSNARFGKPDFLWHDLDDFAQDVYASVRENRTAAIDFRFPYKDLDKKERRVFSNALKFVYGKLDSVEWPSGKGETPQCPPGHVDCPACRGSGTVIRTLKIALEWFLTRRAKVSRGTRRYRIDPGDWGYEEIAAVELCDYYRNKKSPLVELIFETGSGALSQNSKPTRLEPNAIQVNRYPTEKQINRGMLEIRAAQKKLSGMHAQQLKKLKKEMVPGPKVNKDKENLYSLDWARKGVGCHIVHKHSGKEVVCESFTNFKQNFLKAEKELEKKVAKWVDTLEATTQQETQESSRSISKEIKATRQEQSAP